jgi:glycosyltransferase involved in cell wall biosynthesis
MSSHEPVRSIPSLFELLKNEKKVCIVVTNFPPYPKNVETFRGGVTEVHEQLYNELIKKSVDVFVISLSSYGLSPNKDKIYRVGSYIPYSKSKIRKLLFPFYEFFNPIIFFNSIRILIKEKPSCVEYSSLLQGSMAPLVASVLLKIKVFVRNDWLCPNLYAKSHSCSDAERLRECAKCLGIDNPILKPLIGLYSIIIMKFKCLLWNRYCTVIVQSNYHRNLLEEWGVLPEKMILIPPTSTISEFPPYTEELIKLKGNKVILAYVGRLSAEKGFDLLLKSFIILKQKIPDVMLWVAGTGGLKKDLEGVKYLGWVEKDRLGSVYKVADIVVVPTVVPETHPATVDDALKYKKPVVAFKVGALEEMIGNKGIFCNGLNPESLYEGLIKAIDSLGEK